jgi:hypothetical protein
MARIVILIVVGIFGASAAWAEIGEVGNPYQPKPAKQEAAPAVMSSEGQKAGDASAAAKPETQKTGKPENNKIEASAPQEEPKPLVEIAFDRNFVNYTGVLNQGVSAAEKAKPGVTYNVVSYLPAASSSDLQNRRMNERAETNLRAVVGALRQQGIPASRVKVAVKPGTGEYDAVKVFVE